MLKNNKITDVKLPENLYTLHISSNPIKDIDFSKNTSLINIDISFTSITDLDLSNNPNLVAISLEGLSIERINNNSISDVSFSGFAKLMFFNVASTPFTSLDLSSNSMLYSVDISGSAISRLNISGTKVHTLKATRSKLINLIYTKDDFTRLYELRIESTPFEKVRDNIDTLSVNLPNRSEANPGHLYTYSPHIDLLKINRLDYWLINQ